MFRRLLLFPSTLSLLISPTLAEQTASDPTSLTWEELSAEADDVLLWSADPLADLSLETKKTPIFVHSASIKAGLGHSDNYLKRYAPTHQDFSSFEADFFANLLLPRSALTLILFGEWTQYEDKSTADSESLAFGLLEWSIPVTSGTWGLRANAFYGDQIYDASLSIQSAPLGATFRQFRPEIGIFAKRTLSAKDSLETSFSIRDAQFDDPDNDYQRAELSVKLNHRFENGWTSTTFIKGFVEQHQTDSRNANGIRLSPERALSIQGAGFRQQLKGDTFNKTLTWSIEVGAELEIDRYGSYEDRYRAWYALGLEWRWNRVRLHGAARSQETRYDTRQIAYLDETPLLQQFRSLELEANLELIHGIALEGKVEWNTTTSRITTDSYSEHRATLQFSWSY